MGTETPAVGVQLFAWGLAVGACLAGGLAWVWGCAVGYAKGWTLGRREGYDVGHEVGHGKGWIAGVNDAAVLDRLVTLDAAQAQEGDPAERLDAGLRRHRGAVAAWREERRRGLRG